ncbi:MAG: phosphatase PAP2 family protein [Bacteroidetes bacterium]|nr:phosphatase PAP2 family protein [Bacteroidota bacterium]
MKTLRYYFIPLCIYWVSLFILVWGWGYKDSFLILNRLHADFLDVPIYLITCLGDSLFAASLAVLLFPKRLNMLFPLIISVILTGILAQFLKQVFFDDWDRPLKVFENMAVVHTVGNYRLFQHSFPSGHSVTVGTVFTVLAWYIREKRGYLVLFSLLSILVSYTRVYTGAHFPGDVLAGSILGTLLTMVIVYYSACYIDVWITKMKTSVKKILSVILLILAGLGFVVSVYGFYWSFLLI